MSVNLMQKLLDVLNDEALTLWEFGPQSSARRRDVLDSLSKATADLQAYRVASASEERIGG